MIEKTIANIYNFENAEFAFEFLKKNIEETFPDFILTKSDFSLLSNSFFSRFGFFYLIYKKNNIEFKLECERGVLLHEIKIDNSISKLHTFDIQMNEVLAFSDKNILYTLSVLKRFFDKLN